VESYPEAYFYSLPILPKLRRPSSPEYQPDDLFSPRQVVNQIRQQDVGLTPIWSWWDMFGWLNPVTATGCETFFSPASTAIISFGGWPRRARETLRQ
jgi:hypothetical protein